MALRVVVLVLALTVLFAAGRRADASITPADMLGVVDLTALTVSPDGRWVAFRESKADLTKNTFSLTWVLRSLSSARVVRADAGKPLLGSYSANGAAAEIPVWSPDSKWLYFRKLTPDGMQVWRVSSMTGQAAVVVADEADVETFTISANGRSVLYRVGPTRAERIKAEYDFESQGMPIEVTHGLGGPWSKSFPLNGRMATIKWQLGKAHTLPMGAASRVMRLDLTSRRKREVSTGEAASFAKTVSKLQVPSVTGSDLVAAAPRSERLAMVVKEPSPRSIFTTSAVVTTYDPRSGLVHHCPAPTCRGIIAGVAWASDESAVYFVKAEGDGNTPAYSLFGWRIADDVVTTVLSTTGEIYAKDRFEPGACPIADGSAFCIYEDATTPPRVERVSLSNGRREVLASPNGSFAAKLDASPEQLRWTDPDGFEYSALFYRPVGYQDGARYPLVVTGYKCRGFVRGGVGEVTPEWVLSSAGFAALCVNAHRAPIDIKNAAGNVTFFSAQKKAVAAYDAFIAMLARRGAIDTSRVGLDAFSYGATILGYALVNSNTYAAATVGTVILGPSWYYLAYNGGPNSNFGLPPLEDDPTGLWRQMAPALSPQKVGAALLAQVSEANGRGMADLAKALQHLGKPFEMIAYPDEAHHLFQPQHRLHAIERNIEWYKFWLNDEQSQDPSRQEQYTRWRAMKARYGRAVSEVSPLHGTYSSTPQPSQH